MGCPARQGNEEIPGITGEGIDVRVVLSKPNAVDEDINNFQKVLLPDLFLCRY